jgi:hypothetical protein
MDGFLLGKEKALAGIKVATLWQQLDCSWVSQRQGI